MEGLEVKFIFKFLKYFFISQKRLTITKVILIFLESHTMIIVKKTVSQASTDLSKDTEIKVSQKFIYFIINLVKTYMVAFLFFLLTDV